MNQRPPCYDNMTNVPRQEFVCEFRITAYTIPSSPAVSGGCVFIVKILRILQLADTVIDSIALYVCPLHISPTIDTISIQRFNHYNKWIDSTCTHYAFSALTALTSGEKSYNNTVYLQQCSNLQTNSITLLKLVWEHDNLPPPAKKPTNNQTKTKTKIMDLQSCSCTTTFSQVSNIQWIFSNEFVISYE